MWVVLYALITSSILPCTTPSEAPLFTSVASVLSCSDVTSFTPVLFFVNSFSKRASIADSVVGFDIADHKFIQIAFHDFRSCR
jgi:hypothetical protein